MAYKLMFLNNKQQKTMDKITKQKQYIENNDGGTKQKAKSNLGSFYSIHVPFYNNEY